MTHSRKFEYHPQAILEAHAAFNWYAERNEQAAENFWNELVHARNQVTEYPQVWGQYFHDTRCFRLHRYPYGLVYIQRDEKVIGLAVAHFKRCPGYWQERIKE